VASNIQSGSDPRTRTTTHITIEKTESPKTSAVAAMPAGNARKYRNKTAQRL
jgi:hypothetical protein